MFTILGAEREAPPVAWCRPSVEGSAVELMPANPLPADLGSVAVWEAGAEAPRSRRADEASEAGVDRSTYGAWSTYSHILAFGDRI